MIASGACFLLHNLEHKFRKRKSLNDVIKAARQFAIQLAV